MKTYANRKQTRDSLQVWSLLVVVVFAIPHVWYFLLGRLAELAAAVAAPNDVLGGVPFSTFAGKREV